MKKAARKDKSMDNDKLSTKIGKGFEKIEKNFGDMAVMVAHGFDEVKTDVTNLERKLERKIEENHEEIKLKLDNVAYRFELVELQRRVQLLEKKASFRK